MFDLRLMVLRKGAFLELSQSRLSSTTQESERLFLKENYPLYIKVVLIEPFSE